MSKYPIEQAKGPQSLVIIGAPMRNRLEIYQTIERNRQAISQELGRQLAQKYGFEYPSSLEATVLQGWQEFLAKERAFH